MPSKSPWVDYVPPGYLGPETDPPNTLFFGPDPCWSPAREKYTAKGVPGSNHGKAVIPETCPECRGREVEGTAADPMGDSDLVVRVCARCCRSTGTRKSQETGGVFSSNPKRFGRMATKVKGKADATLNAYLLRSMMASSEPTRKSTAKFRPRASKSTKDKG